MITKTKIPNTRYRIPDTKYQMPNTKCQISNTRYQIPNTICDPDLEKKYKVGKARAPLYKLCCKYRSAVISMLYPNNGFIFETKGKS